MVTSPTVYRAQRAVTLLELMTVIVIIAILAVVLAPAMASLKARAQKTKCIGNLHGLHVAASLYMQDNQHWPQIPGNPTTDPTVVQAWLDAFSRYGLSQQNWICPSIQDAMLNPDFSDPTNKRIDYFAMPFSTRPSAPFEHSTQPWFIETADIHGNGQEIIYPDGHISEAVDLMRTAQSQAASAAGHK